MTHASCPAWVEDAVWAAARAELEPAVLARSRLLDAIVNRSRRYTSERDQLGAGGAADLAARALFFTVADVAKAMVPLAELGRADAVPSDRPVRVLDLGAGVGAMTFGVAAHRGQRGVHAHAVDRDAAALGLFRGAFDSAGRDVAGSKLEVEVADVRRWQHRGDPVDIVIAGSVLNELPEDVRVGLVARWLDWINDAGAVVLVEPALRDTARALHRVRDAIVAARSARVFAPCLRQGTCPALADPADWCHEDRPTELPPRTRELARATGLRDGGLKFSYLVLRKDHVRQVAGDARAVRVVSHPKRTKGKLELYACGDHGRTQVRLLKRNRSDSNRALERARRGDVLALPTDDVGRDTTVSRLCGSDSQGEPAP